MKNINKEKWADLAKQTANAVILDVRTPEECAEGVIPNAKTVNYLDPQQFLNYIETLDKDSSYFIYCRSGKRSWGACQLMQEQGFKELYNLDGGILAWDGETKVV